MVNTKIIRQPSQPPLLSSLLLYLSLHHPPSSLFFLSPHHITLKSPTLTLSLCSISLTLAPPPRVSLSEPDTHRILFLLSPPQFPIRHSIPASLSLFLYSLCSVYLVCYSLRRVSIVFAAAALGGTPIGFDLRRIFGFAGVPRWRSIFLISCFDK